MLFPLRFWKSQNIIGGMQFLICKNSKYYRRKTLHFPKKSKYYITEKRQKRPGKQRKRDGKRIKRDKKGIKRDKKGIKSRSAARDGRTLWITKRDCIQSPTVSEDIAESIRKPRKSAANRWGEGRFRIRARGGNVNIYSQIILLPSKNFQNFAKSKRC